jgi:small ligand-binding sensory domain FIST
MAQPDYASAPTLGLLYITDLLVPDAEEILDFLGAELPEITDWSGTVGIGIAASNAEYFDEPALAVMLCELPSDQYRVFSGVAPLGNADAPRAGGPNQNFQAYTALVHADPATHDLPELIGDVSARTETGYLFGGLSSGRGATPQFAIGGNGNIRGHGAASGVFSGGLSGVGFGQGVRLVSRVTQGCQPVSPERQITEADGNLLLTIDGEPALDVLLADLHVSLDEPQQAIEAVRATLVGLAEAGMRMTFVRRNAQTARTDLMRICAEIREELEPEEQTLEVASALAAGEAEASPHPARRMAGAVYVSCSGRGGPHFGAPGAEMQIVRHALGDVPLVGFFAAGEIARHHLYGYTGVLTVFVAD